MCSKCAAGRYQPDPGQPGGSCSICPAGFYSQADANACAATSCPAGMVSLPGATSATDCRADCPAGQYVNGTKGQRLFVG